MATVRNLLTNLAIVFVSLLLTLASCEIGIRLLQRLEYLPVYNHKTMDKGDTANKRVNAKLVRSANPVLFMEFDRADPNINNAGFRGPDFALAKPAGTVRIAILGDSVAYGYSVPAEQTFARLLEQNLNADGYKTEVLNFAVNGYSTLAQLELYKTRVREYRPDIVLLAYVLNDPLPAAFVVQSVGSARKQVDTFRLVTRYSQFAAWCWMRWQALVQPLNSQNNYHRMYQGDSWRNTTDTITALQQETAQDGAALAAVIFPLLLDFDHYPMLDIHRQIAAAFEDRQIPYIDLLADFRQTDAQALRPHPNDDTHPNAAGHAIAEQRIRTLLQTLPPLRRE